MREKQLGICWLKFVEYISFKEGEGTDILFVGCVMWRIALKELFPYLFSINVNFGYLYMLVRGVSAFEF